MNVYGIFTLCLPPCKVFSKFHLILIINRISKIIFSNPQVRRLRFREIKQIFPFLSLSFITTFMNFLTPLLEFLYINTSKDEELLICSCPPSIEKKERTPFCTFFSLLNIVWWRTVHIYTKKFPLFIYSFIYSLSLSLSCIKSFEFVCYSLFNYFAISAWSTRQFILVFVG